jgi:hypothetical protein
MKNKTLKVLGLTFVEFKNKEEGDRIRRGIDFKSVGYHPVPLYIILNDDGYIVESSEVESWKNIFEEYYTDEYIWKELDRLSKEEDKKHRSINKVLKEAGRKDLSLIV